MVQAVGVDARRDRDYAEELGRGRGRRAGKPRSWIGSEDDESAVFDLPDDPMLPSGDAPSNFRRRMRRTWIEPSARLDTVRSGVLAWPFDMGLDVLEMAMAIEKKFQIRIPDETWARLRTVGETHDEVVRILQSRGAHDVPELRATIWDGITRIIEKHMGIPVDEVRPDSRWYPDIAPGG